jgi:hypothetical protein
MLDPGTHDLRVRQERGVVQRGGRLVEAGRQLRGAHDAAPGEDAQRAR